MPTASTHLRCTLALCRTCNFGSACHDFWCSNHCLQTESGRSVSFHQASLAERVCKKCYLGAIEDEDHFLVVCPAYAQLRDRFIDHMPLGPITPVQESLSC